MQFGKYFYWLSQVQSHYGLFGLPKIFAVPSLLCSGRHNKIPKTGWVEHQKFIFSQFWSLEATDQGARMGGFWWGPSSWLVGSYQLTACSHGLPQCAHTEGARGKERGKKGRARKSKGQGRAVGVVVVLGKIFLRSGPNQDQEAEEAAKSKETVQRQTIMPTMY